MRIITLITIIALLLSGCKSEQKENADGSKLPVNSTATEESKKSFAPGEFDPRITQDELNEMLAYMDDRSISGFQFDPRGFLYVIKTQGAGNNPQLGDKVTVNYQGRLIDDKEFDSTYKSGKPLTYRVGKMIPGFDAAVMLLKPGAKGLFIFPPFLAYENKSVKGPDGKEIIPPKSKLVFDLELVSIDK